MALCSLSTGSTATPRRRAASITRPPAMTSTSLLARAMVLPASMAASTASSAAVPDEAHSTRSTSGCVATAMRPSLPTPADLGWRSAERGAEPVHRGPGGHRDGLRAELDHLRGHRAGVAARGQRDHRHAIGVRARHVEGARADRSGGAEDGDARQSRARHRDRELSGRQCRKGLYQLRRSVLIRGLRPRRKK